MRVFSSAMEVVGVNRRVVERLLRGEYSSGFSPINTTAVDLVAVKAEEGPTTETHAVLWRDFSEYQQQIQLRIDSSIELHVAEGVLD